MKIVLAFPPTCDPTAPYISLPLLAACLREAGHEVMLVDANLEAYERLLRPEALALLGARLERRLSRLEARDSLDHQQQLAFAAFWAARGEAIEAPRAIEGALATLRDRTGERFYDPLRYGQAVLTVEGALQLIGAAHHPLQLSFAGYRTPFSLLDMRAILADARTDRDPFAAAFAELAERLRGVRPDLIGLSVVFPGQIQPAYALAGALRKALPGVPVLTGGPAITQLLLNLDEPRRARALGPFHAAVLYEGEAALLEIVADLARGRRPAGCIEGGQAQCLADLPAPDFDGLPLERYLSPQPVLPYDLSRGCYWGRCAFCHYGLAARGCARYRERPVGVARKHLAELARRYDCQLFYLSQDSVAPRTVLELAREVRRSGDSYRWSTDLRPEPFFDDERCRELRRGGALSVSLGFESAAPRVLSLIDKGLTVEEMRGALGSLAAAGMAVELMCFTGFPTETGAEARETLRFIEEHQAEIALFVCGDFALTAGSRVAADPSAFGVREVWRVRGDELRTALFYEEDGPGKSRAEGAAVEEALHRAARRFSLRGYPWAGSLSTAHSMLYYHRHGPEAFKRRPGRGPSRSRRSYSAPSRFDVAAVAARSVDREEEIWSSLIYQVRAVSRANYLTLAQASPSVRPRPGRWRYAPGRVAVAEAPHNKVARR